MEGKKIGQIQKKAGEGWFSIPRYNKLSSICIPNMSIPACMVVKKSLAKNFILQSTEGKKIRQIQGRISRRRLVLNPTLQEVFINQHTKYEHSSLHGCGLIFDEKVHQIGADGMTDGRTDVNQCTPPPHPPPPPPPHTHTTTTHFFKAGV